MKKKLFLYIYLLLLFSGFLPALSGQDMFKYYADVKDSVLYVRFEEKSLEDWKNNIRRNFLLRISGPGLQSPIEYGLHKPSPAYYALNAQNGSQDSLIIAALLYTDLLPVDDQAAMYPEEDYPGKARDTSRYETLRFLFKMDFQYAYFAGYGYKVNGVSPNATYQLSLVDGESGKVLQNFSVLTSEKEAPLPEVRAKFVDKEVLIEWESRAHKEDYWAYRLFHSVNGGRFEAVDSQLLMNIYEDYAEPLTTEISRVVELGNNEDKHVFRLFGVNHLGHLSTSFREVEGQGYAGIGLAPLLQPLHQNPNNTTLLQWSVLPEFQQNIAQWLTMVGEERDGPFTIDSAGLAPDVKTLTRNIPYDYSYFKVGAVDLRGDTVFSPVQMVWGLDTIPPATPADLEYTVDKTGFLTITWTPSFEDDLIGYNVFRCQDSLGEYTIVNSDYLQEPSVTDTLYLRTNKDHQFYKIVAVDFRNNRSPFSKILRVEKPDVVPPIPILFTLASSQKGFVDLFWENSVSDDVVEMQLLRKLDNEAWKVIASWDGTSGIPEHFKDSLAEPLQTYIYTAVLTDDAGLQSEPAHPIAGTALPNHDDINVNDFRVFTRNEKEVLVVPYFDMRDVYQIFVYKRDMDQRKSSLLAILEPGVFMEAKDTDISQDRSKTEYFLKAYFKDGAVSPYSKAKTR